MRVVVVAVVVVVMVFTGSRAAGAVPAVLVCSFGGVGGHCYAVTSGDEVEIKLSYVQCQDL